MNLARLCLVAVATTLLVLPAPAGADRSHVGTIFKWVPEPNKWEYFEGPCGVAVDSSGDIYASDYYRNNVNVYSPGGVLKTRVTSVEPSNGPCGLAVGANGDLFVNVFHESVQSRTPATFPLLPGTTFSAATTIDSAESTGVAIDPSTGRVYVNDRTYVSVYDDSGAPVLHEGAPMRLGEGSLNDAYGVAVSDFAPTDGYVYVADASGDTVKVFDPAGDLDAPVTVIDGAGTPTEGFTTLRDASLAVDDANGNLIVVYNAQGPFYEHPIAAVAEFNPAGEYRGTVSAPSPLLFGEPSGVTVDNWGGAGQSRLLVTSGNSEAGAVYLFAPVGPGFRLELVVEGGGVGTVGSSPAGVACPPACAAEFDSGSTVTLEARPAPGSVFEGWSGDCAGAGSCLVSMDQARTVTAQFGPAPPAAAEASGGDGFQATATSGPVSAIVPAPAVSTAVGGAAHRRSAEQRKQLRKKRLRQRRRAQARRRARRQRRAKLRRQSKGRGRVSARKGA